MRVKHHIGYAHILFSCRNCMPRIGILRLLILFNLSLLISIVLYIYLLFIFLCIASHCVHWSLCKDSVWAQCLIKVVYYAFILVAASAVIYIGSILVDWLLNLIILNIQNLIRLYTLCINRWLLLVMGKYRVYFFNQFWCKILVLLHTKLFSFLRRIERHRCVLKRVWND